MNDIHEYIVEFEEVISSMVPSYLRDDIMYALQSHIECGDLEEMGLRLVGGQQPDSHIEHLGEVESSDLLWKSIKNEIYDLVCRETNKYKYERTESRGVIKHVVTIVSTAVASRFDLSIGLVVGAVTVALMSVLKVGRFAWCAANKPQ